MAHWTNICRVRTNQTQKTSLFLLIFHHILDVLFYITDYYREMKPILTGDFTEMTQNIAADYWIGKEESK